MPSEKNLPEKSLLNDLSLWFLLISNIVTICIAMNEGWDLQTLMWIYWFQSIIIGFFSFLKILSLKDYYSRDFRINGKSFAPTIKTKVTGALFFAFHYGIFHLVYLLYLTQNTVWLNKDGEYFNLQSKYFYVTISLFFVTHLFSFFYNLISDTQKRKLGAVIAAPYYRILPMHLVIMLGSIISVTPLIFLILKTIADCKMHINEHKDARKDVPVDMWAHSSKD
jgi:hypothetical protein